MSAEIGFSGETDRFTVDLDDGQTATVVVGPDAALEPTIELFDPDGASIGNAAAGAAGNEAMLQVVPITSAGTYTVEVGGAWGSTGTYTAQLILNAAVEEEGHGGQTNDDPASAQDLNGGFIPLDAGTAERAALLGKLPGPAVLTVVAEDFESGVLGDAWTTSSSQGEGRIQVTGDYGTAGGSFALLMDRDPGGISNLNEAIWTVDLSGLRMATLGFSHAEFSDVTSPLPADFSGSVDGDGVAISDDGVRWHTVFFPPNQTNGEWVAYAIDLAAEAAAAGMTLGPEFQIKFQQYGSEPLTADGRGYDEIVVTTPIATEDWYRFTLDDGQSATLALTTRGPGDGMLELFDDGSNRLASGVAAANVDQTINHFVDATADGIPGTYFARVTRNFGSDYSLLVTRDADFDTEPNNVPGRESPDITPHGVVLGHVGLGPGEVPPEEQKLTAADAEPYDHFGYSVAISGDAAIVGASSRDGPGAGYILRLDGGEWRQQQKLIGSAPEGSEKFGYSVAIDGDIAVVGDPQNTVGGAYSGAAYVYHFDGSQWVQRQRLIASDANQAMMGFGDAVSISGDTVIVGAERGAGGSSDSGAAYAFRFDGVQWVEQQKLISADGANYDCFGSSVSVDGDTAVVGARLDDDGGSNSGSAYVFQFDGSQWQQQHKLTASNPDRYDFFGDCVSLSGDTVIVGASGDDDGGSSAGAAYVFGFDGAGWVQQQKLVASDAETSANFGLSASLSGDTAIVGAHYDSAGGSYAGAAYFYRRLGDQWVEQYKFHASDIDRSNQFGHAVSISGHAAIVGMPYGNPAESTPGSAYLYTLWPPSDCFAVDVRAGDSLAVSTATPGGGTGQPVNPLDPVVELYDFTGTLVARDDNSGPDGRNARLTHTATFPGVYTVRVLAAGETTGQYVLGVSGQTGAPAQFAVAATEPASGTRHSLAPPRMTIDFNDSLLLSTLDASDLTVDGVPAVGVTVVDGHTATFDLPAGLADGSRQVGIAAGAVLDVQGTPIEPFSSTFIIDTTPPRIVSSSLRDGAAVATGTLLYTARFDEQLDAANLDPSDVELLGLISGRHAPSLFHYDPGGSLLTLEFADLPEDAYTLTLLSGDGRLEDLLGHDLDGEPDPATTVPSGDGTAGGDFIVNFTADRESAPWPLPLQADRPMGSGIYEASAVAVIGTCDDTDRYTIDLEDGQTIALAVDPDETLRPVVELWGPGGASMGRATAGAAGESALLQVLPTAGTGTYTVTVAGTSHTVGRYTARLVVNAAVSEERHDGPANDDPASAQDLDASFIPVGGGTAQRGALLASGPPLMLIEDFESGALDDQWTTWWDPSGGLVQVTAGYGAAEGWFAMLMDNSFGCNTCFHLEEAIWTVNLWQPYEAELSFYHAEWEDEETGFAGGSFTGHQWADGVAISDDGQTWYPIWDAPDQPTGQWQQYTLDLAAAAAEAGLVLGADFKIKFQQCGYDALPQNGRGFDQIVIRAPSLPATAEDWYCFTLDDGRSATAAATPLTRGALALELYDGGHNLLAAGIAANNVGQVINNFRDATSDGHPDTYFLRVTGSSWTGYSLTVTRQADFDTEPNGGRTLPGQDITPNGQVLGFVGMTSAEVPADEVKLGALDAQPGDSFGDSVSISGNTAMVGATGDADQGENSGSAYVFQFDGNRWRQQQKLTTTDAEAFDRVGYSVSLSGDVAVVGAPGDDDRGFNAGAAYVFRLDGDQWTRQQKLTASDACEYANFGSAVSISGDAILVGAYGDEDNGPDSGAAYVFRFDGAQWSQQQKLVLPDGEEADFFGRAVSISGNAALVGAEGDNGEHTRSGAAYVFQFDGSQWTQQQRLTGGQRNFGHSVSIRGDAAIVGARAYSPGTGEPYVASTAHVFRFDGNQWLAEQVLTASSSRSVDGYAESVAIRGDVAMVGAPDDDGRADNAGAAYLYHYVGGHWSELRRITPSDAAAYDRFGYGVAVCDDVAIVGAPDYSADDAGAAYVFDLCPWDEFAVNVRAGDPLVIRTATPGDGPGEFVNDLDPVLELYDPAGTLVAADDNGAPDGRNALLTYTAPLTGTYGVRVSPTRSTQGEFVLHVTGNTGQPRVFEVTATDPADGMVLHAEPSQITVHLSDAALLGTLDASDLTVDGVPAAGVAVVDGNTVVFDVPGELSDGEHGVAMTGGAILDLQGTPLEPFAATFTVAVGPRVVSSSVLRWSTLPTGSLVYTARFNEPLIAANLDPSDVSLEGISSDKYAPDALSYDTDTSTLTLEFSGLPEDDFALTLRSGDGAFEDSAGNDLDGEVHGATTVPSGNGIPGGDFVLNFSLRHVAVVGRYVFYNNSAFDGENPEANAEDDAAIATDKVALLPTQTATFDNYTSYSRGINGIMVDVAGLPHAGPLYPEETFEFRLGNDDYPADWTWVTTVPTLTVRWGAGTNGSDRITVIFPDNVIQKQWLRVTVLAGSDTGLAENDVFYFGNAIGESGNSTTDAKVNAVDMLAPRNNPRTFIDPAPVDFDFDYNRDARVNATDMLIARNSQTNFLTALNLITVPGDKSAEQESPGREPSLGRLDWLFEFEPAWMQQRHAEDENSNEGAVDKLLAGYGL